MNRSEEELWEQYHKEKMEYLRNRKPERYKLLCMGEGFLIRDTLNYYDDNTSYMLIPDMFGRTDKRYRVDEGYLNPEDLVNTLNYLDYKVNGNLYDDNYWVLNDKERLYNELKHYLDESLNNLVTTDSLTFNLNNIDFNKNSMDNIKVKISLARNGLPFPEEQNLITNEIIDNLIFSTYFKVLNDYLDNVENSKDHDDMIRADTIIELKMRLVKELEKVKS